MRAVFAAERAVHDRYLLVQTSRFGPPGVAGATVRLQETSTFVDRVLHAGHVDVAVSDDAEPIAVQPRGAAEPATAWLSRVLRVALNGIPDLQKRCGLVLDVIESLAGRPVRLMVHPSPSGGVAPADPPSGRAVLATRAGIWLLADLPPVDGLAPLVDLLALTLSVANRETERAEATLAGSLADAVSVGDAQAFAGAIADTVGGRVDICSDRGELVAQALSEFVGTVDQDIVVHRGDRISGSIEVRRAMRSIDPELVRGWAAAMLRVAQAEAVRAELENEVAVRDCLVELDPGEPHRTQADPRRLVLVQPAPTVTRWAIRGIGSRMRRAAATDPVLRSLAVAHHGASTMIGVYDAGPWSVIEHRRAWDRLRREVGAASGIRVVIGTPVGTTAELQQSVAALRRLAAWQLELPQSSVTAAILLADEIGPLWSSLSGWPVGGVLPYLRSILGTLLDDGRFGGELTDTLHAYLQNGGSLQAAAEQLHLHTSTVKYRMRVLRGLLGDRLTDPDQRFELELALRIHLAHRAITRAVEN